MNQIEDIAGLGFVLEGIKTVGVWGRGDSCRLMFLKGQASLCSPGSDSHTPSVLQAKYLGLGRTPH